MIKQTYEIDIITPCFCAGAEPDKQAEIRAPSIRGQLRWWFRVLGGFGSLAPMQLREQEDMIFGSAASDEGLAGKLIVRVLGQQPRSTRLNAEDLHAGMDTSLGYALFPLRPFGDSDGKRGTISEGVAFQLSILWRGDSRTMQSINALVAVWAHLGSLGFRSRRSFGALRLTSPVIQLSQALTEFTTPSGIVVKRLEVGGLADWRVTSSALLKWYRSWRQHGQMNRRWDKHAQRWILIPATQQADNRSQPGFQYARRDHNEGLDVQGTRAPNPDPENPKGRPGQTFRPALGLPIIQFFSSLGSDDRPTPRTRATVNWEFSSDGGRFASPVLLRPHKDSQGDWHALVIFADVRQWQNGDSVYLNGISRVVLLDLYEAMKADERLLPFI